MRLKEDSSSYNSSNVSRKMSQPPDSPRHKSKKDTKKWCKGIVGRGHNYEWASDTKNYRHRWTRIKTCSQCNKQDWVTTEYWCAEHQVWSKRFIFAGDDPHQHDR